MNTENNSEISLRGSICVIASIIAFAALAKGAHDIWAATIVYVSLVCFVSIGLISALFKSRPISFPPLWPFLLFGLSIVMSYRGACNPSESILELSDTGASILLFFVALQVFQEKKSKQFFYAITVPIHIIQLFGIIVDRAQAGTLLSFGESSGQLINPNFGACFSLFWVIPYYEMCVNGGREQAKSHQKIWFSIGLFSILLNLTFYGSLWAVVALAFGFSLYFRLSLKNVAIGSIALILVVVGWKLLSVHPGAQNSFTNHIGWWGTGLNIYQHHRLFGVGIGNYPQAFLAFRIGGGENTLYAHNILITLISEIGLMGILSLGALAAVLFISAVRKVNTLHDNKAIGCSLIAVFIYALFNVSTEILVNQMMWWLALGIYLAPVFSDEQVLLSAKPVRRVIGLCSAVGILFTIPFFLSMFVASQNSVSGRNILKDIEPKDAQLFVKLDQAKKYLNTALELDPRLSFPHEGLATVAWLSGQFNDAQVEQRKAIEKDKYNARLWWELALMHVNQNDLSGGLQIMTQALDYHKNNAMIRSQLEGLKVRIESAKH